MKIITSRDVDRFYLRWEIEHLGAFRDVEMMKAYNDYARLLWIAKKCSQIANALPLFSYADLN